MPLLYLEPSTGPQYSVAKSYLINLPDPTIGWKETENSHKKDKERRKKLARVHDDFFDDYFWSIKKQKNKF